MPRREGLKKVDISLSEELYHMAREPLARRNFSTVLRLAIKRLRDAFALSPEGVTEKLRQRLPALRDRREGQLTKRVTVEFRTDELAGVDRATEYFRQQGLRLVRQDVIKFALLEWPNPK